ncbi:MAG: ABC transporter permease [Chitinophagales bacterium]|nr:ABC transporter permease [Chitinophagales bacterium]
MNFQIDFKEIFQSITRHKLRNSLTGFGIAWGILILMIMMGLGDSFQKGIFQLFSGYAENTIFVWAGETSMNYKSRAAGQQIQFGTDILVKLKLRFPEIEKISPEVDNYSNQRVVYQNNFTAGRLSGVDIDFFGIKKLKMSQGRLFTQDEIENQRAVCILPESLSDVLFKGEKQRLGNFIQIQGNYFRVVGIAKPGSSFDGGDRSKVYIPTNYYMSLFNRNSFEILAISLNKETQGDAFVQNFKAFMAQEFSYHPDDSKAIYLFNLSDQVKQFQNLFSGLRIFILFVGFCILLTGIISVGNIMYVNINERTKEIGIRKAIGATPYEIQKMILLESLVLTLVSGLVGMTVGFIVLWSMNAFIVGQAAEDDLIQGVGVNFVVVFLSLLLIVISGILAGYLPARKASNIKSVLALNQEN